MDRAQPAPDLYASPALRQQARQILRRLADSGAYATAAEEQSIAIFVRRNGWRRPVLRIAASNFAALIHAGLVAPIGQAEGTAARYGITEAAHSFLRREADPAAGFRGQHMLKGERLFANADGNADRRPVNLAESPLGWLAKRKGNDGAPLITEEQREAGERLREDFTRAQLTARVTMDWSRPLAGNTTGPSQHDGLTDTVLAARRRVAAALEAVGPGLADMLIEVCCHLRGLEATERSFGWPSRAGKVVLRIALDRLVDHYGLGPRAPHHGPLRAWSAAIEGGR